MPKGKVIYLPAIYDPKKIREGVIEILSLMKTQKANAQGCEKVG